jgi:hypothetical protein
MEVNQHERKRPYMLGHCQHYQLFLPKIKNTTLSEQFQNPMANSLPITHKYMKTRFPDLIQARQ